MTTYLLVHGGHHGGWCYKKVARLLRNAGHEVYSPTLTGLGERRHLLSADVDLDMHIADVVPQPSPKGVRTHNPPLRASLEAA